VGTVDTYKHLDPSANREAVNKRPSLDPAPITSQATAGG